MFSRPIKSCSDENSSTSQGGYSFTLYGLRKVKNLFRKRFYISVWVVGFYEYECYPEGEIEMSAQTEEEALKELKEYLKSRYGKNYGTLIKYD